MGADVGKVMMAGKLRKDLPYTTCPSSIKSPVQYSWLSRMFLLWSTVLIRRHQLMEGRYIFSMKKFITAVFVSDSVDQRCHKRMY